MNKVFFKLLITIFCCQTTNAQVKKDIERELNNTWKVATINNIDSQLCLLNKMDSFYLRVISSQKEFIQIQSETNGLRESFLKAALLTIGWPDRCHNDIYIVENYRGGEAFEAEYYLYELGSVARLFIFELSLGKWTLKHSKIIGEPNDIKTAFNNSGGYLCNMFYRNESVIITRIANNRLDSKAFFFPCSDGFKTIKQLFYE